MKTRLLGFGILMSLWAATFSGCSSTSVTTGTGTDPNGLVGDQTKGTVRVFLADPGTDDALPQVRQTLTFFGIDDNGTVTFPPVTLDYNSVQSLENVPLETTSIIVQDPDDPSVLATEQVTVLPGQTTCVSDVVLLPARTAPLVGLVAPKVGDGKPVQVGAGFVQTTPSTIGDPGANNTMAGANATSATDDLPHPYKTNSWLSPILYADNHSKVYAGGGTGAGQYNPSTNPQVLDQRPVYPHPWILGYSVIEPAVFGRPNPPIVPNFPQNKGLKLIAEVPSFGGGPQLPAPDGGNLADTYGLFTTVPGGFDMLQIDPGFTASRIKVARMGDYDADLMLRSVDDPQFAKTGLPETADLKLTTVRGNPLVYFTASDLPKVDIYHILSNLDSKLTATQGVINVSGTAIAYVAWTGKYRTGDFTVQRSTALFYPQGSATYSQGDPINNSGAGGDGTNAVKTSLTFKASAQNNYFTIANLPDGTFQDEATLTKLAQAAFSIPTNTVVDYKYNQASQTVDETYTTTTTNVLNLPNATVSGLMPHHYQPSKVHNNDPILTGSPPVLTNSGGSAMVFPLAQGPLQVYTSGTWTCRYPVPGILPFMPPLDAGDAAGRTELNAWIQNGFVGKWKGSIPSYTNQNAGKGIQTYQLGKYVLRNMLVLPCIDQIPGNEALSKEVYDNTKAAIELYFRETPTQTAQSAGSAPYYNYYDALVGSMSQYPQGQPPGNPNFPSDVNVSPLDGFGPISRNNDHHFHYGYFIHAAALIALREPAWGTAWRDAINQYIFDVANTNEINPTPALPFPKERNWDAYMNHSYSAGLTWADVLGNNQESTSEEINFWLGTALWGAATNQPKIQEHALERMAPLIHSIYVYWFDINGNEQALEKTVKGAKLNWGGLNQGVLYDGQVGIQTFFGTHPAAVRVITVLPVGAATFYLAMSPDYAQKGAADYLAFIKKYNIDPFAPAVGQDKNGGPFSVKNPWLFQMGYHSQIEKFAALSDPANAWANLLGKVPNNRTPLDNGTPDNTTIPIDMSADEGDTLAHSFQFTRYLQFHGKPELWIKANNSAFFMVFTDTAGKKRTYVGFNPTGAAMNISFTDGTVIAGVAPRSLGTKEVAIP